MSSNTIVFKDSAANIIRIKTPVHGYKSSLIFPWEIQELDNGKWESYDPTSTYDARTCECEFYLDAAEQNTLMNFLGTSTKARADAAVTMYLSGDQDFRPFAPDKGNAGSFTIGMQLIETLGIGGRPYGLFHTRVLLVNHGAWPSYSAVTDVDEGSWNFGTVSNVRFPPDWFKPNVFYASSGSMGMDGHLDFVDKSTNADRYESEFHMVCNQPKAERILAYITATARAGTFNITTAANHYIFDRDKGTSGTHTVRLLQNRIEVMHPRYNMFEFDLHLGFEA
ncbi:MAG: hypothetical protein KKD77_22235 [Gammaproteobacteria bacterium]|nr:hypothetical protein [Gammaproteobacteria bacterium]